MLLTFGHGTASPERMISLLRDAGVSLLIDVRTAPGSRRHPHVARAELQRWLPGAVLTSTSRDIPAPWSKPIICSAEAAPCPNVRSMNWPPEYVCHPPYSIRPIFSRRPRSWRRY